MHAIKIILSKRKNLKSAEGTSGSSFVTDSPKNRKCYCWLFIIDAKDRSREKIGFVSAFFPKRVKVPL